jgi:surface carbohydrate biosynthesis protein (TIGR04326 family)
VTGGAVVWDDAGSPPPGADAVLLWRSYARPERGMSVPLYIEEHGDRLRSKYLAFIHELGQTVIAGKRVVDHLDRGDGLSYWWMSRLSEKSTLKSPGIYDCVRLLALEEIILGDIPSEVRLVSGNEHLVQPISDLCEAFGIEFKWERRVERKPLSIRGVYRSLPHPIQGFFSMLRYCAARWPLRRASVPSWFGGDRAVFICSYFIHLDAELCARGTFYSRQWGPFPALLEADRTRVNWLQHFLFSKQVPDTRTGVRWLRSFNADAEKQGHHAFLDSHLSVSVLGTALRDWLRLLASRRRLASIRDACKPRGSAISLWPVLCGDWETSLAGVVAVDNCIWAALFEVAFRRMPTQKTGFYICENQGWERAMLHAWRKCGHGEAIAVQHATVPFWHLYYFDDSRSRNPEGPCAMPQPDRIAVNGPMARIAFESQQYSASELLDTEALRYIDSAGLDPRDSTSMKPRLLPDAPDAPRMRVLILGDMLPAAMGAFLRLVEEAARSAGGRYSFTLKPHPGFDIQLSSYPDLRADKTTQALEAILPDYDVALSANSTSASVDAYLMGLPVIVMLDGDSLNLSPLRGRAGVTFVGSAEELSVALAGASSPTRRARPNANELFFLTPELPRWKRLLASLSAA